MLRMTEPIAFSHDSLSRIALGYLDSAAMPHEELLKILSGMWAAQATGTFARLRIADVIAGGAQTVAALAKALNTDPDATHRLVRACATIGLVAVGPAPEHPVTLTPVGELLREDAPLSFRALLDEETAPGHWLPWGRLDLCVTSGKPSTDTTLGSDIWDYYAKTPAEGATFSAAMGNMSKLAIFAASMTYQFPASRKVVDVGGAHGDLLAHVLAMQPGAEGVLFDLPNVVAGAPAMDRVTAVGGSFMNDVPAGGDLYLLKTILHDWNDATCLTILTNVRKVMAPGGKIVVIEMVIPEDGSASPVTLLDLNMLVLLPGRERTATELTTLLRGAGFATSQVFQTPSPFAVIEAT